MTLGVLGPEFRWFWAARMVTVVGSSLTAVAMPVIVYDLTGSASLTSLVTALQVAPYLVLGLLAGAMADRVPRRRVMLTAQAMSAIALMSVPVTHLLGTLHVAHVLVVAAVVSSAFVWFDAAAFGALPAIVGRSLVTRANSALWTASTLLSIGAPALGGLLVAAIGAHDVLAVDAASYVAAATCLLMVARPMGPETIPTGSHRPRLRSDIAEGVSFLWHHDVIRPLTLMGVANSIAAGAITGLLLVLAVEQLGVASGGTGLGILLAVVAVGGFAAAVGLPRMTARLPVGWLSLGGMVVGIPAALVLAGTTSVLSAGACLLVWSAGHTVVVLNGISLRQMLTPDHLQARVNTTGRMVAWGGAPVGAVAGGLIAQTFDVRLAVSSAAVVLLVGSGYGWRAGLSRRDFATHDAGLPGVPGPRERPS